MRAQTTCLLILLHWCVTAQTDITKVFTISPTMYDLGTEVLPAGDGFAVFGYQTGGGSGTAADLFMLRLDKDGQEISRRIYGEQNKGELLKRGVVAVGNDGWLMAGSQTFTGTTKAYLVRIDANGNVLWTKVLPYISLILFDIVTLPSGGYMALGQLSSRVALLRLTENGEVVWLKDYTGSAPRSLYVTAGGGNVIVANRWEIMKIRASNGQLVWSKPVESPVFGNPDGDIEFDVNDMVPVGNGQFAVTGTVINTLLLGYQTAPFAGLYKENGDVIWTKVFPAPTNNTGSNSILYLPNQQELCLTGEGNNALVVNCVNLQGNLVSEHNIPTPGLGVYPVLGKYQGKYMLTGGNFQGGMNTLFYRSGGNWLPDGVLRPEDRSELSSCLMSAPYPNPASTMIALPVIAQHAGEQVFRMFNTLGQTVFQQQEWLANGENQVYFDIAALPSGTYWIAIAGSAQGPLIWIKD